MRHNQKVDAFYDNRYIHKSIMWREIVDIIDGSLKKGKGLFADCTLGEGGHSEIILKLYPEMRVRAFERDPEILDRAKERLEPFGDRIDFVNDNFSSMAEYFDDGQGPDYILYDFGISSYHLQDSTRGFSFSGEQKLDMSLDGEGIDASYVVNRYPEKKLSEIFKVYGEERWAVRIAKMIVEKRKEKPFETTADLASLVLGAIPKKFHVKNIHPATRIFQAIRIEVNGELDAIKTGLEGGFSVLQNHGVIMGMSFHSLEDRIVKNYFKQLKDGCTCGNDPKYCMCRNDPFGRILTKKPVMAQDDELAWNNRSRSAKLRAFVKESGDGEA